MIVVFVEDDMDVAWVFNDVLRPIKKPLPIAARIKRIIILLRMVGSLDSEGTVFPEETKSTGEMPAGFAIEEYVEDSESWLWFAGMIVIYGSAGTVHDRVVIVPKAPTPVNVFKIQEKRFIHAANGIERDTSRH